MKKWSHKMIIFTLFASYCLFNAPGNSCAESTALTPPITINLEDGFTVEISSTHAPSYPVVFNKPTYLTAEKAFLQQVLRISYPIYSGRRYWASAYLTTPDHTKVLVGIIIYDCIERAKEIHVESLSVSPFHRRKGIGRALIEYVEKTPNYTHITLISNPEAGIFYRRLNYKEEHYGNFKKVLIEPANP